MRIMADLLSRNRPASEVMAILAREEMDLKTKLARSGRNDPCPCGSGKKVKKCHGKEECRGKSVEGKRRVSRIESGGKHSVLGTRHPVLDSSLDTRYFERRIFYERTRSS
jgi:hypothetical protein